MAPQAWLKQRQPKVPGQRAALLGELRIPDTSAGGQSTVDDLQCLDGSRQAELFDTLVVQQRSRSPSAAPPCFPCGATALYPRPQAGSTGGTHTSTDAGGALRRRCKAGGRGDELADQQLAPDEVGHHTRGAASRLGTCNCIDAYLCKDEAGASHGNNMAVSATGTDTDTHPPSTTYCLRAAATRPITATIS